MGVGGIKVREFVGDISCIPQKNGVATEDTIEFNLAVRTNKNFGILGGVIAVIRNDFGDGISIV